MRKFSIVFLVSVVTANFVWAVPEKDYLLFSYDKVSFSSSQMDRARKTFKVLIDTPFLAQFNKPPTETSAGTAFVCLLNDSFNVMTGEGISFHQWFSPWQKGKVKTWSFALGSQEVKKKAISAPNSTSSGFFANWQGIDTSHHLSFVQEYDGVNLGLDVEAMKESHPDLKGAVLALVKAADGSTFVAGDDQTGLQFKLSCNFQNN